MSCRQFKAWELCRNNLTENKDDVNWFSDNFWNDLFLLLIKKIINVSCTLQ